MDRGVAIGMMLAALLVAAPAAGAQDWHRTTLPPEMYRGDKDLASTTPIESVLVHDSVESVTATPYDLAGQAAPARVLFSGGAYYPSADGSAVGGVVAAWQSGGVIAVAERPPGRADFEIVAQLPGGQGSYSYGRPQVAVNETGAAVVVYLGTLADGTQELRAIHRPAGGRFGAPETIGLPADATAIYPRDVALGPDGTAIVGFVRDRVAHAATRPPLGPWLGQVALGARGPEQSWSAPLVGVDAAGHTVALWLEEAELNSTGPVKVAFGRASVPAFGPVIDTGLRASSSGRLGLGVSALGEVVVSVEAATDLPRGGTHIEGLHVVMGNAAVARLGPSRAVTSIWGDYPSFAMNARGDAVLAWTICCPMAVQVRRRAPLEGFGPIEDVQPPISFTGSRSGITVRDADIDERGTARIVYTDGEVEAAYLAQRPGDLVGGLPPLPALGALIPPVLALGAPDEPDLPDVPDVPDLPELPELPDEPGAGNDSGDPEDPDGPEDPSNPDEGAGRPDGGSGGSGGGDPSRVIPEDRSSEQAPPAVPPTPNATVPVPAATRAPSTTAPDRRPPVLSLRVGRRLRTGRPPRLPVRLRCTEGCRVRITGVLGGRPLRPASVRLRDARTVLLQAPRRRRGAAASAVRLARLRIVATDAAGNVTRRSVTARVRG